MGDLLRQTDAAQINRTIHPDDGMKRSTTSEEMYFRHGRQAVQLIRLALAHRDLYAAVHPPPRRILDFGCGYGRVTRFLRAHWPDAEIVASDVLSEGVAFCADTFDCTPHISSPDLSKLSFTAPFDIIFAGSVVTHLPGHATETLLDYFARLLVSRGVCVFSAGGRKLIADITSGKRRSQFGPGFAQARRDYEAIGYGFAPLRTQYYNDANTPYGSSLTSPAWVWNFISRREGLALLFCQEKAWCNYQDVYALYKTTDASSASSCSRPPRMRRLAISAVWKALRSVGAWAAR